MKVFVAISEADQDVRGEDLEVFTRFLDGEGLDVSSSLDVPPGVFVDSWLHGVSQEADCVLLVVTPDSAWEDSYEDAVTLDVAAAHPRTMPLLLEEAGMLDIPHGFRRLFSTTGYMNALANLRRLRAKLEG